MPDETGLWADAIGSLAHELDTLLHGISADEWQAPAASVGWTCWRTAEHIAGDFAHYAAQVIGQPRDHYVKFGFDTSRAETPEELREIVFVAGGLLAASVRTASISSLGWHPHGFFTPAGFAAIGAAEGIVHGHDIAAGLGIDWSPGPELCARVLSAVFPDAGLPAGSSALEALLAETGRDERPAQGSPRPWNYTAGAAFPLTAGP
jgi:hypothetical protein